MPTRRAAVRLALTAVAVLAPPTTASPDPGADGIGAWTGPGAVNVEAHRTDEQGDSRGGSGPRYAFQRIAPTFCGSLDDLATSAAMCVDGVDGGTVSRVCEDGSSALDPLFRRELDPATGDGVGPWEQVDNGGCPEDGSTVLLTASQFRRLPLTASTPQIQPADGLGLVHMDVIVWTDPAPQTLTTTVLGVPVTVVATPASYSWDFGDGAPPLVTTDPGGPYPDGTVARPYDHIGSYAITLTTTWTGRYQVDDAGPWLDVVGTAVTTSTSLPTRVVEAHSRLVANP
jgi:hypothetical protein